MASLSISRAWDEAKAIIARDGRLLGTLALALFVLPGVISDIVVPPTTDGLPKLGWWNLVTLAAVLVALVGQLAVIRLAIGSRNTVGEVIRHAAGRAPAYIAATVIWLLPFLIIGFALAAAMGDDPANARIGPALGLLLVIIVLFFLAVRMIMTSAVASAEPIGPIDVIRRSWAMTHGHWLQLFGFILLFLIAVLVVLGASGAVFGLLFRVLFGELRPMSLGMLFLAIVTQVIGAAVSVVFMTMIGRIYVQLAGRTDAAETFR